MVVGNKANYYSKWTNKCRCEFYPSKCPAMKLKYSWGQKFSEKRDKSAPGTFTGKKHTIETKLKISNTMKGNRNANHRGDRQTYYRNIRMDSKWEKGVAKYFDNNNIEWKYSEKDLHFQINLFIILIFLYMKMMFLLNLLKLKDILGKIIERNLKCSLENFLKLKLNYGREISYFH